MGKDWYFDNWLWWKLLFVPRFYKFYSPLLPHCQLQDSRTGLSAKKTRRYRLGYLEQKGPLCLRALAEAELSRFASQASKYQHWRHAYRCQTKHICRCRLKPRAGNVRKRYYCCACGPDGLFGYCLN